MKDIDFARTLTERAATVGVALSPAAVGKLLQYYDLLSKWNRTINLTALPLEAFPATTLDRLLLEPLAAARFVPADARLWLDLGSGGGSPAIPMKLMRPGLPLTMVESRGRKAAFLREAVRVLDLSSVTVMTDRFELLAATALAAAVDVVTARAVRIDAQFLETVARLLTPGGVLLYFGTGSDVPPLEPPLRVDRSIPLLAADQALLIRRS